MPHLLLIGRWHAVTRDQEAALRREIDVAGVGPLVFVITAADQGRTKRHPLTVAERSELVGALATRLGRPFAVYPLADVSDSERWVEYVQQAVATASNGAVPLRPDDTIVISGNPDVLDQFAARGFTTRAPHWQGAMPADVLGAIVARRDWQALASADTVAVYERHGLEEAIQQAFAEVLLTDDGELSSGRNFQVYAAGMDASLRVKLADMHPHVCPGLVVDKGCGTGSLLVHLSALFPDAQIVGLDLSRELLRIAESQHYPAQNVSIVKANIIHPHFARGTVSTAIFSSVMHEIYSYNGYDRDQVRLALRSTLGELQRGGRVIIRDGVRPESGRVWMRCDEETERRFRRFAGDFKGKSAAPGVRFEEKVVAGQTWFVLDLHEANEFLSKKDYLENWAIEVHEEFGVFTLAEWRRELAALGYRVLEARSYLNLWILEHRYTGRVWLHADGGDAPGPEVPFPDTTAVIVGEAGML